MDRYLEKEMEAFRDIMNAKGYTEHFLVNHKHSGELLPAMQATAMEAYEQEYDPFPMILHTRLSDPRLETVPVIMFRVDHTDRGLNIRDAEVEGLVVNGKPMRKELSFSGNRQFPSKEKLLNSLLNTNRLKHKRKGL